MRQTLYHSLLRIASLSVAIVLVFDSGVLLPVTKELSQNTQQYLANAVGMNASVTPNEVNQITANLTEQKRELERREAELQKREIAVGLSTDSDNGTPMSTYLLSAILFVLLVLILLNYLLDFIRQTRSTRTPLST